MRLAGSPVGMVVEEGPGLGSEVRLSRCILVLDVPLEIKGVKLLDRVLVYLLNLIIIVQLSYFL